MEYSELIDYSGLKNGKKPLQSQVNSNCYYLTEKKIYVVRNEQIVHEIPLPKISDTNGEIIGFYDMLYDGGLKVIIDTRIMYSYSMILDEEKMILTNLCLTKW